MNKADNEAGSQAIDSLINYETVKVRFHRSFCVRFDLCEPEIVEWVCD